MNLGRLGYFVGAMPLDSISGVGGVAGLLDLFSAFNQLFSNTELALPELRNCS